MQKLCYCAKPERTEYLNTFHNLLDLLVKLLYVGELYGQETSIRYNKISKREF